MTRSTCDPTVETTAPNSLHPTSSTKPPDNPPTSSTKPCDINSNRTTSIDCSVVGGVMAFFVIGEAVVIIALLLIMIQRKGKAQNNSSTTTARGELDDGQTAVSPNPAYGLVSGEREDGDQSHKYEIMPTGRTYHNMSPHSIPQTGTVVHEPTYQIIAEK